jgi:hypothetical protein
MRIRVALGVLAAAAVAILPAASGARTILLPHIGDGWLAP